MSSVPRGFSSAAGSPVILPRRRNLLNYPPTPEERSYQPTTEQYDFDQPITNSGEFPYEEESYSEEEIIDIESKYRYQHAGFREDPYGGHWSSPTQSETDTYCRYYMYSSEMWHVPCGMYNMSHTACDMWHLTCST